MSADGQQLVSEARAWRSVLPNALSLFRLLLGCCFPLIPADLRLSAVAVAALTDLADGALSRRLHAASSIGRALDPIADKVFVLGVVLTLIAEGSLPGWQAGLIGLRDVTVLMGAGWLFLRHGYAAVPGLAPSLLGKATTAAQFIFLLGLLVTGPAVSVLFVYTSVLSGLAALDYAWRFWRFQAASLPSCAKVPQPR